MYFCAGFHSHRFYAFKIFHQYTGADPIRFPTHVEKGNVPMSAHVEETLHIRSADLTYDITSEKTDPPFHPIPPRMPLNRYFRIYILHPHYNILYLNYKNKNKKIRNKKIIINLDSN